MEDRRTFENLRIWQWAMEFTVEIYSLMSPIRDYGFRDQIQRASVSIMNNITEGFESGSDSSFVRYLNISKASCYEVKSMLYLAERQNYCSAEQKVSLQNQLRSITNGIYRLIQKLPAQPPKGK